MSEKEEVHVKCPKCGYEWDTSSKLGFVTCPSCCSKVRRVAENATRT